MEKTIDIKKLEEEVKILEDDSLLKKLLKKLIE